jgi:hypothetical protein
MGKQLQIKSPVIFLLMISALVLSAKKTFVFFFPLQRNRELEILCSCHSIASARRNMDVFSTAYEVCKKAGAR